MEYLSSEKDEETYALENELRALLRKNFEDECFLTGNLKLEQELKDRLEECREESERLSNEYQQLEELTDQMMEKYEIDIAMDLKTKVEEQILHTTLELQHCRIEEKNEEILSDTVLKVKDLTKIVLDHKEVKELENMEQAEKKEAIELEKLNEQESDLEKELQEDNNRWDLDFKNGVIELANSFVQKKNLEENIAALKSEKAEIQKEEEAENPTAKICTSQKDDDGVFLDPNKFPHIKTQLEKFKINQKFKQSLNENNHQPTDKRSPMTAQGESPSQEKVRLESPPEVPKEKVELDNIDSNNDLGGFFDDIDTLNDSEKESECDYQIAGSSNDNPKASVNTPVVTKSTESPGILKCQNSGANYEVLEPGILNLKIDLKKITEIPNMYQKTKSQDIAESTLKLPKSKELPKSQNIMEYFDIGLKKATENSGIPPLQKAKLPGSLKRPNSGLEGITQTPIKGKETTFEDPVKKRARIELIKEAIQSEMAASSEHSVGCNDKKIGLKETATLKIQKSTLKKVGESPGNVKQLENVEILKILPPNSKDNENSSSGSSDTLQIEGTQKAQTSNALQMVFEEKTPSKAKSSIDKSCRVSEYLKDHFQSKSTGHKSLKQNKSSKTKSNEKPKGQSMKTNRYTKKKPTTVQFRPTTRSQKNAIITKEHLDSSSDCDKMDAQEVVPNTEYQDNSLVQMEVDETTKDTDMNIGIAHKDIPKTVEDVSMTPEVPESNKKTEIKAMGKGEPEVIIETIDEDPDRQMEEMDQEVEEARFQPPAITMAEDFMGFDSGSHSGIPSPLGNTSIEGEGESIELDTDQSYGNLFNDGNFETSSLNEDENFNLSSPSLSQSGGFEMDFNMETEKNKENDFLF